MHVVVGKQQQYPMRLLMVRVPKEVAEQRRQNLLKDASRRAQPVSQQALELADWTILLTDVPSKRLRLEEALVRLAGALANRMAFQTLEAIRAHRGVEHDAPLAGVGRVIWRAGRVVTPTLWSWPPCVAR